MSEDPETRRPPRHVPPTDTRNRVQRRFDSRYILAPDGGEHSPESGEEPDDPNPEGDEPDGQTMRDVDHSPPDGDEVHDVYRRGTERE